MQNIIYLPSALGAVTPHNLYGVNNDTPACVHADTGAIAAVTGEPVSRVRDAIRLVLFGAGWVDRPRPPFVGAMSETAIEETLRVLGYIGRWTDVAGLPTLAAYLNSQAGVHKGHPYIVSLTDRRVTVSGDLYCDMANRGHVIDVKDASTRRQRVQRVFIVTYRIFGTHVPTKGTVAISRRSVPARKKPWLTGV